MNLVDEYDMFTFAEQYAEKSGMFAMHVDDEDKKLNDKTSSSFGQRGATIINESDFYSLVLASRMPNAKKFKC